MSSTNVLENRIYRHGIRAAARAMEGLLHGYENPMDSPLGLVQPIEIQGLTAKIDRNSVWNFGLEGFCLHESRYSDWLGCLCCVRHEL